MDIKHVCPNCGKEVKVGWSDEDGIADKRSVVCKECKDGSNCE